MRFVARLKPWSSAIWHWLTRVWRKIWSDPIALTALLLSLFAAGAQLTAWLRGPSVRLIMPNGVALFLDVTPDDSTVFVRVAADMSYANVAQQPYGTVVTAERATLSLGGATSRQRWNSLGTIDREAVRQTGMAAPQALPGQAAVTHFTLFAPVPVDCPDNHKNCEEMSEYLPAEELLKRTMSAKHLHVRFDVHSIEGEVISTDCFVPLKSSAREQIVAVMQHRRPYFYAACRPTGPVYN